MKKGLIVVACALGLFSVNAVAGGCIHADGYAKMKQYPTEDVVAKQEVDPNLLALMKKHEARQSPVEPVLTFN